MFGRRKTDKWMGRLFIAGFVLNVAICVANVYWLRRFVTLVHILASQVQEQENMLKRMRSLSIPSWRKRT